MFLKSIEIRGFKSFADKTELQFKHGITAVVGPNGSGKSNISDAVRWVLGEQSVKNLRGGKMADVIFAGTQFRKPVGLAQVSLTLDNNEKELDIDYSDVRVTRRLYRSGESEYFVNNTKCRLKDIQELFMDTGIGKEGYSLIGQGKIDSILSGKPEERRKLLEEAAGIVKFKTRKEEAEKRLEYTKQNLVRINDILSTYESRLEPLKNEMEKAKRFLKLSDELKVMEINLLIDSIEKVESKISIVKEKVNELNNNIDCEQKQKNILKQNSKELDLELENFDEKVNSDKQNYYDIKTLNQSILSDIKLLEEKINNFSQNINKNNCDLKNSREKINELKEKECTESSLLNELKINIEDLAEKIQNKEENIFSLNTSISDETKELKKSKDEIIKVTSEVNENNNKIMLLNKDIDVFDKRKEKIYSEYNNYSNKLKINSSTVMIVDSEKNKCLNNIKNIQEEIKENTNKLGNYRRKLSIKEKNITELNKKLNGAEANYNVLINLNDQFEGYTRSVKSLMKRINNEHIKGVKEKTHVLGEVITVNKECEIAIEIAMGASISNIITDDDIIAKRLINYLKENKLGRATFLPLNIIKGRKIDFSGKLKKYKGFKGIASELVQYDDKFKNIIEYALGRVIVADNMDNALMIAKGINYSYKIVTLQGELVNPGGSLTGGSIYKRNASVFGRKREILELKEQSKILKKEISVLKEQLRELNDTIKNLDEQNLNLKDKVHFENVELTKINAKLNTINEENKRLNDSLIEMDTEMKAIDKNLNFNKDSICEIKEKIVQKTALKDEINLNINKIEIKINDIMVKIENEKNILTELKIKKAQLDENISSRNDNLNRIKGIIKEQEKISFDLEQEIKKSIENKNFCIKELEENKIKNKDTILQIENYEKIFKEYEIQRLKIKEKISLNGENLDKISLVVDNYEKQLHRYQLNFTKIESEKEMFYSKLNDEMQLTYAEALESKQEISDLNKLKVDIGKTKNEISNLGLVNVGAIEEYKEVSEKYTFMNDQREDLITSKQEITDVINEMTEKMRIVFKENFKIMREYFDETFKELFKGGSADLILADGDELTAKIDINVQPPGKKLQNINLMSGGEKVLSAIALLFAILKMKPTPFCILDEIEAALDDANVYRYAEFLKKFSDKIQFIVITHRKGTMEASDVLYGITMEEKGVSKIVSVDLTEQLLNA